MDAEDWEDCSGLGKLVEYRCAGQGEHASGIQEVCEMLAVHLDGHGWGIRSQSTLEGTDSQPGLDDSLREGRVQCGRHWPVPRGVS